MINTDLMRRRAIASQNRVRGRGVYHHFHGGPLDGLRLRMDASDSMAHVGFPQVTDVGCVQAMYAPGAEGDLSPWRCELDGIRKEVFDVLLRYLEIDAIDIQADTVIALYTVTRRDM